MWKRPLALIISVGLLVLLRVPLATRGANTIGFGVGVPPTLPIDWDASFSFAAAEILAETNLSFLLTVGTYPVSFPELYEGNTSLLVKAWAGPVALYAGGGFSLQWQLIGGTWLWSPFVNLMTGMQLWIHDSVAFFVRVRSLDPLPTTWSFNPEIALGVTLGLGRVRPPCPRVDGDYLWLIIGLWVLAFIVYYPRS